MADFRWRVTTSALASIAIVPFLVGAAAVGCGDNLIPAELAGESAHFRFFIDTSLTLPAIVTADDVLAGLEANFADVQTMLGMPDAGAKINYYWLTDEHIRNECPTQPGGACQFGEHGGSILTDSYVPHEHELIHAYASLMFTPHRPPLVLAEGLAESIACLRGPATVSHVVEDPWQTVVTARRRDLTDVYGPGMMLARYLILNYGIEPFLRYYGSAPRADDPAVFANHFSKFWSREIEDVWSAMQVRSVPRGSPWVRPICPCGRQTRAVPKESTVFDRSLAQVYWTLPDLEGDTLAVEAARGIVWADCRQELINYGTRQLLFSRVSAGRYFMTAAHGRLSRGPHVSNTCDDSTSLPYDLPADLITPFHEEANVRVVFDGGESSAAADRVAFLHWRPQIRMHLVQRNLLKMGVCATCDFDAPECQPKFSGTVLEAGSTYHIKLVVEDSIGSPTVADLQVSAP